SNEKRAIGVNGIIERTGAERAGLKAGDLIVMLDGQWYTDQFPSENFRLSIASRKPRTTARIGVLRGGKGILAQSRLSDITPEDLASLPVTAVGHGDDKRITPGAGGLRIDEANATARELGLEKGDLILSLDGQDVSSQASVDQFKQWSATAPIPVERK